MFSINSKIHIFIIFLKLDRRFRKADVVLAEVVRVRLPVHVTPDAVGEEPVDVDLL